MEKGRSSLETAIRLINNILAVVAAVMIVFMMVCICYSVIVRFLGGPSAPWILEISSYLMLYITFLCMAWLQGQEGHVRIDLFTSKFSSRGRAVSDIIMSLGGAVVGFILAWKGSMVTLDYFQRHVTVMGILNTPQFVLMAIIPVGGILLFLQCLLQIWNSMWKALTQTDLSSEEPAP